MTPPEDDDILIAEVRAVLRDEGLLDEDTIDAHIEDMRDAGAFRVPSW